MEAQMKRGLPRGLRARGRLGRGILRLSDREGRAREYGAHGIHALSVAQAPGEGGLHHRALRPNTTGGAEVLPHHGRRGCERIAEFLAEWPSVQEIYRYVEGAHHDAR